MPHLIYGTAWKKERTVDLVVQAFEAGFRSFDSACQPRHYAEPLVGEAFKLLRRRGLARGDFYIQTKYTPVSGQDPETTPYDAEAAISVQVKQSAGVSLKNLNTDYLNGLILHSPFAEFEHTLEAWRSMEQLHHQGIAIRLGISNCYQLDVLKKLYQQAEVKPQIVQNRFYDKTQFDVALRAWCRQQQITYQSFWTLTANPKLLNHPQLQNLATKYGKSPEQILFNYLRQRQVTPLTGTSSRAHMEMDLASFDTDFTEQELDDLDKLLRPL